jgi:hypothetical protein
MTAAQLLDAFGVVIPQQTDLLAYQWYTGYMLDSGEGYVTDVWDAATVIESNKLSIGTIAAFLGIAALFVGAMLYKE